MKCVCPIVYCIILFAETVAQFQHCLLFNTLKLRIFFTSKKTEAETALIGLKYNSQGILLESLRPLYHCVWRVHQHVFRWILPWVNIDPQWGKRHYYHILTYLRKYVKWKRWYTLYSIIVVNCWFATQNRLWAAEETMLAIAKINAIIIKCNWLTL